MAFRPKPGTTAKAGIDDPGLFPHRLSFDEDLVGFLPTNAGRLRAASFLDGRSDFSTGPARAIAMRDVLRPAATPPGPHRYIFHVSFCGSTLLSRLLDHPGRAIVLREPQCLSDLAARRAMLDQAGDSDSRVDAMLARLPALLDRRWQRDEAVVIKPSNWVNNLVLALCAGPPRVLPIFLTITPRAFLQAVFRGGGQRIAFTARAAVHFSQAGHTNAPRVAAALQGERDQAVKLARLAALAHRMQEELFAKARTAGGWGPGHCLDFAELSARPLASARRAAVLLGLDLPEDVIAANARKWLPLNAKAPEAAYSGTVQDTTNRAVDESFGRIIDEALDWARTI
jgi:hypothetical protein